MSLKIKIKQGELLILTVNIVYVLYIALTAPICSETALSIAVPLIALFFIKKREFLLSSLFFTSIFFYRIPPDSGIPISPIFIVLYILSYIIFIRLNSLNKLRLSSKTILSALSVITLMVLSCMFSITGSYSSLPIFILFILLLYYSKYDKCFNVELFEKLLFSGAVIAILYIFFKILLAPYISLDGRRGLFEAQNVNATARGISMLIIVFVCFAVKLKKQFLWLPVIVGIISIILTGSRTGLLATFITLFLMAWIYTNNKARLFNYCLCSLPILATILAIIFKILGNIGMGESIERFASILSLDTILKDTRLVSWELLLAYILQYRSIWYGIGLGNVNSKEVLEYVPDGDNMYIDTLSQVGIIGLLVLISYITSRVILLIKSQNSITNRNRFFFFLPIGLILQQLTFSMTETIFDEIALWFTMGISYLYINNNHDKYSTSIISRTKLQ